MNNLGSRIKTLREARGMTRFDLSVETRIPEQNIRLWEKGRTPTDPARVAAIADALGTTTDYLITGLHPRPSAVK